MLTSAILAGAAAQAVNAQGAFVLPTPAAGPVPMLSEAEARAHAAAWAHDFGPYNRTHLEERHGGRIDFAPLTPCPRGYFAATPYDEVPADVHPGVRNFHDPQWLVSLCSPDGTPVVSVAVAAYATNNVALESGTLTWRGPGGSEYFVQGIPAGQDFPESPERAAELAARRTGRRVTAVPELVLAGSAAPQYARWRITLDAPVAVRALKRGAVERTNVLYVGAPGDPRWSTTRTVGRNCRARPAPRRGRQRQQLRIRTEPAQLPDQLPDQLRLAPAGSGCREKHATGAQRAADLPDPGRQQRGRYERQNVGRCRGRQPG